MDTLNALIEHPATPLAGAGILTSTPTHSNSELIIRIIGWLVVIVSTIIQNRKK